MNFESFEEKNDPIKSFFEFKNNLENNPLYLPTLNELKLAFSITDNSDMSKYDIEMALSYLFVGKNLENTPFEIWVK